MIRTVAFLHHRLQLGGAEKVSFNTAKLFAKQGIQSYFFAMAVKENQWQMPCEDSKICLFPRKSFKGGQELDLIIERIKEEEIDLLFVICPIPNLARRVEEETNCKLVFWLHSAPFWELVDKPERKQARLRSYPLRLLLPLARVYWSYYFKSFNQRIKQLYQETFEHSSAYLVLCPEYKDELIKLLDLNPKEAQKVYPIVNTITLPESVELKKKKEIVFLGRLSYADKRVDRLVDIWAKVYQDLPEWSLKIYGDGKEEKRLRKQINALGLERISLEGFVSKPSEVLQHSAILCQTSTYEGVPMAMIEAQSYGVVPVAFASTSGIRYVANNNSAVLVEPFDLEQFAQELKTLCLDEPYRRQMQENSLLKSQAYTNKANEATWEELLKTLS